MKQSSKPGLDRLFQNNRQWAASRLDEDPDFFRKLARQQAPDYLWIGCSDSRVPANQIVGLPPGEVFVHRNVANQIIHTDLNCLSVMQFAVDVLKVKHIIVCGHYGCGGVQAALNKERHGLVDNWLRHVEDIHWKHKSRLEAVQGQKEKLKVLCRINVIEQVLNASLTTVVQDAWKRKQNLTLHGLVYGIEDGFLRDLGVSVKSNRDMKRNYGKAIKGPLDSLG